MGYKGGGKPRPKSQAQPFLEAGWSGLNIEEDNYFGLGSATDQDRGTFVA